MTDKDQSKGSTEEWRPIPGYEGFYSASNRGRVRRERATGGTYVGRIVTQYAGNTGYALVTISRPGVRPRGWGVHQLVAMAFVPGRSSRRKQVNHRNGDRQDNSPSNLEWVDASENAKHAMRHLGYRHEPVWRGKPKLTEAIVREARRTYAPWCRRNGATALAKRHGVTVTTMLAAIKGRTWRHVT